MDVSAEQLEHFFTRQDNTYQIRQEIREKTIFAQHNILTHPPFLHLDILDVRSLLLYTSPDVVQKLIPLFHYALNPGGILILGIDYSAGEPLEHFETIDATWKIYRRAAGAGGDDIQVELPSTLIPSFGLVVGEPRPRKEKEGSSIAALAREWLLSQYAPPAVIVNENGDILYFQGRTGKYLEPHPGRATLNVHTMAREGLRYPLASTTRTALQEKRTVTRGPVFVQTNGSEEAIRLTVRPIREIEGAEDLLMVVFEPVQDPAPEVGHEEGAAWKLPQQISIKNSRDQGPTPAHGRGYAGLPGELRSMNEKPEHERGTEEHERGVDEFEGGLQSLNEELLTVNAEHQRKVEELSESNDDMRNLLQSTDIAMLFLDNDLRVRQFTNPIRPIVNLQAGDTGRPSPTQSAYWTKTSWGCKNGARHPADADEAGATADGKWYLMRILPYRTTENRIEGSSSPSPIRRRSRR